MSTFRLVISILFFCFGVHIVVMNWLCVADNRQNKRKGSDKQHNLAPLISVIFCGTAWLVYPYLPKWWVLLPVVIDPGTWILLCALIRQIFQKTDKAKV